MASNDLTGATVLGVAFVKQSSWKSSINQSKSSSLLIKSDLNP